MKVLIAAVLVVLLATVTALAQTSAGSRTYIVPGIDTAKGHNSRVIQSTGAVLFSRMQDAGAIQLSGVAGLTSIGRTRRLPGDTSRLYLGVWVPLDVKLSVPGDDGPQDSIIAGPSVYAYPNPFSSWVRLRLVRSDYARAEITVYDMNGRAVAAASSQDMGDVLEFYWDGLDPEGSPVPAGIYAVSITAHRLGSGRADQLTTTIVCTR